MTIDNNFRIEFEPYNVILVKSDIKHRISDDKKGRWRKGDEYTSEEKWYYSSVPHALIGYLHKIVERADKVEKILDKIKEVEKNILEIAKNK